MNEIPKNAQGPSIPQQAQAQVQKTEQVKQETVQDVQAAQQPEVQAKEIKDIPDNPADRSAVKIDNLRCVSQIRKKHLKILWNLHSIR